VTALRARVTSGQHIHVRVVVKDYDDSDGGQGVRCLSYHHLIIEALEASSLTGTHTQEATSPV
jgi:hypothetical protein